jgi:hypothetical protein
VIGSEQLFANDQGFVDQLFGLLVLALLVVQLGQVVHAPGNIRMPL